MPKTGGNITKEKILKVSETLFAEKGFDATGMDAIAKEVGINKASIYYHFKSKNEIFDSLVNNLLEEIKQRLLEDESEINSIEDKIRIELDYLRNRRKIIALILMEALKDNSGYKLLFNSALETIKDELSKTNRVPKSIQDYKRHITFEFFSGFIPMITYVVMEEKWSKFNSISRKKTEEYFIETFINTHLKNHI